MKSWWPTKNTSDAKVDTCKIRTCSKTQDQISHDKVSNTVDIGCPPPPHTHTSTYSILLNTTNDKYELDLKFKPKYKDIMDKLKNCPIFKLWDSQTKDKYGFISLGNQTIPDTDLKCSLGLKFFLISTGKLATQAIIIS